jgi:osmotically-inducible protein OsmY
MKKTRFLSLVYGLLADVLVAGCATTQPDGEQIEDSAITTKIEAKLAGDPDVSAFNVDVDTNEGVVRLSGAVEKPEAKAEAEKLARETEGVRRVINDITVGERTMGDRMDDTAITASVKAKLTGDPDVAAHNVNVDTKDGVVTLRGTVKSEDAKQEAEELARNTEGVRRVQNMIEVEEGS